MNLNFTLIAQALTFALFIWFCNKYVWPFITRAIDERQKKIIAGLADAEQARVTLENASKQADISVREARERSSQIILQAEQRATQMVEEAKSAAREEGAREKTAAQADIDQQMSSAKDQLREQVAALAVAGAEKILQREVNAQVHSDLLKQLREQLR
ncbi:MAG TPA: F0F1 ATP synthase subunit B [Burkholderiaceae bacterium]|nr:F0F1 ATP synthase subunit B [Burkholderiaceae bacterium]